MNRRLIARNHLLRQVKRINRLKYKNGCHYAAFSELSSAYFPKKNSSKAQETGRRTVTSRHKHVHQFNSIKMYLKYLEMRAQWEDVGVHSVQKMQSLQPRDDWLTKIQGLAPPTTPSDHPMSVCVQLKHKQHTESGRHYMKHAWRCWQMFLLVKQSQEVFGSKQLK